MWDYPQLGIKIEHRILFSCLEECDSSHNRDYDLKLSLDSKTDIFYSLN